MSDNIIEIENANEILPLIMLLMDSLDIPSAYMMAEASIDVRDPEFPFNVVTITIRRRRLADVVTSFHVRGVNEKSISTLQSPEALAKGVERRLRKLIYST